MNIKTEIEIVTGFLSSGKTSFINALLKNSLVSEEVVIIIQYEMGNTQIKKIEKHKVKIILKQIDTSKNLTASFLKQIIEFYKPHRIIVEYNGTKLLKDILVLFNDKALEESCREPVVYHLVEAAVFRIFYENMKELIEPYISNSNLIVLNNCESIATEERKHIVKIIKELNSTAIVLTNENIGELEEVLKKAEILENRLIKRIFIKIKNRQAKKIFRSRYK